MPAAARDVRVTAAGGGAGRAGDAGRRGAAVGRVRGGHGSRVQRHGAAL